MRVVGKLVDEIVGVSADACHRKVGFHGEALVDEVSEQCVSGKTGMLEHVALVHVAKIAADAASDARLIAVFLGSHRNGNEQRCQQRCYP
mgnify:FL=1